MLELAVAVSAAEIPGRRLGTAGVIASAAARAAAWRAPGHDRGQVCEDVAEGVAGGGGAQQDGTDPGEPVEQVVLAERAGLAARDPGAGGIEPLAGDAVHVAAEGG